MSVRVRLTRVGSKKNPIWRVVVSDQRSPRDGRFIETIGHYNPQTEPSTIVIDEERFQHWVSRGAQPTNTVRKLMRAQGIGTAAGASATAPAADASAPAPDAAEAPESAAEASAADADTSAADASAGDASAPKDAGTPA